MTATPISGTKLYRPRRMRWTRARYEALINSGLLTPDDRLELLEGEIVEKMTHNGPHATGLRLTEKLLNRIFTEGYDVRAQLPLALGDRSEPEPDVAVVTGTPRDYKQSHPTTAVLVVEISDSTLRVDRTTKASLYARAGIPEYWILNITERVLEVYRQPVPMRGKPLGYGYAEILRLSETERFTPLSSPDFSIAVADLLP